MDARFDPGSTTWRAVRTRITARLVVLRAQLEAPGTPHDETEGTRAAIKELTNLLDMENPAPEIPESSTNRPAGY